MHKRWACYEDLKKCARIGMAARDLTNAPLSRQGHTAAVIADVESHLHEIPDVSGQLSEAVGGSILPGTMSRIAPRSC